MKLSFRVLALISLFVWALPIPAQAISTNLVISQLYLGTGNSDARPRSPYIELFNLGTTTVNLQGWTLQYAQEDANAWKTFPLAGDIAAGQYYLIRITGSGWVAGSSSAGSDNQPHVTAQCRKARPG